MKNLILFFCIFFFESNAIGQIDYNGITVPGDSIPTGISMLTVGSVKQKNETKKDTVAIDVLYSDGFALFLQTRKKERVLEYKTVVLPSPTSDFGNGVFISHDVSITKKEWVMIKEKFIEPTDGCYLLFPLFNDR